MLLLAGHSPCSLNQNKVAEEEKSAKRKLNPSISFNEENPVMWDNSLKLTKKTATRAEGQDHENSGGKLGWGDGTLQFAILLCAKDPVLDQKMQQHVTIIDVAQKIVLVYHPGCRNFSGKKRRLKIVPHVTSP